jgi:outer membrane immunogenic protein
MRRFLISTCAISALLASTSAIAASGGAAEALSYTWTGLYGGINAGYAWGNADWDFAGGAGSNSHDNSGGVVGLQLGYSAQVGDNLFAGIEGSLDSSHADGDSGCGANTCETQMRSFGDVSARLGVTSGRALLFVKGGIAYEDSTHHIKSAGIDRKDNGGTSVGYLLGLGAEYALTYNLTTKLEYNYMGFGSNDYTVGTTRISVDEPLNIVKFGINYRLY